MAFSPASKPAHTHDTLSHPGANLIRRGTGVHDGLLAREQAPPAEAELAASDRARRRAGIQLQVTSYELRVTSYELQATSYKSHVTSYKLQATSCKLQATSYTSAISAVSRLYLGHISAVSRPYLGCISAISHSCQASAPSSQTLSRCSPASI